MRNFIALKAKDLRQNDLGGLVSETVEIALLHSAALGPVGTVSLQLLDARNRYFHIRLSINRASLLSPRIREKDRECGILFADIMRMSKAAGKSMLPATSAAGKTLVALLHPFRGVGRRPIVTQMAQIENLSKDYAADPAATPAAETLGIASLFQALFAANAELHALYGERADATATAAGPSASSLKNGLVTAYNKFCITVAMTLMALPSGELQQLCYEMNSIRRKYISRQPKPLSDACTSAAPIPMQAYTGRAITPIPRVFYNNGKEVVELEFARDFSVTYRKNVNPGEAHLYVRGKGKYTGSHVTTFHIDSP
jgi:hypothetical protein